jgi:acid phosphatase
VLAALGPKGLLVLTWDEDDSSTNNHILTVFVGPQVITGAVSAQTLNHFTLNRMICDALGLAPFANGRFEASVENVWKGVTPTRARNWGRVKSMYR